ncbi:hypothetical protein FA09DRAFT_340133 [Tilletiopsis washingtonensis]|uniref:RING-type E3 ubiquitin transferase n=1 Tax=Tilletiopsis washingtonensis TaxID=58919 RepID=A0A316Z5J4_9BASI|nr:hypothetical protein FA09DRAFT_340133 [Tilletiopsis washingtonensis]PWN96334.1 hypothetical protein FA09DRAFT_340133 [Tilletiopsis washingtonensis]
MAQQPAATAPAAGSTSPRRPPPPAADEADCCLICLQALPPIPGTHAPTLHRRSSPTAPASLDRVVLPACSHALFCLPCIVTWRDVSARCPLCSVPLGPYVLHNLHATPSGSRYAFAAPPAPAHAGLSGAPLLPPRRPRFGAPVPRRSVEEAWDLQVRERRSAYVDDRWALHVGSNRASGYSATASPSAIAQSSAAQARLSAFLHRELYALPLGGGTATGLDVPFLRAYIAALARTVSLRSDEAVRLLHAFLQPHTEHFLHELDCYMRSNRGLREWDRSRVGHGVK